MPEGDSFLPRIQSVFYAVFDVRQGSKIVYQVPEGLIAVPSGALSSNVNGNGSVPPTPSVDTSPVIPLPPNTATGNGISSRNSSASLASPTDYYRPGGRPQGSPHKRSNSSQRTLFHFSDISMFVIPPSPLCGRLVTYSTRRHRIIGFPVELKGPYERNFFRYNLCFVFDREADLSCYEPIVRKVSRVLKSCEEESGFLSSVHTSPTVHAILEQLYEDLNSYSETSIHIDQFNSIELKIFPFYPNPPPLEDWMVPLALINLSKRIEENWDLTMLKICKHINGVNHVSRIAHLADCDIALTRQAISHLLYYQVIMTIDIFQYSNMYTLKKSMQWLADEPHVKEECGSYVTKPDRRNIPDWPTLLHFYSRLKPGKTIYEWMKSYDVESSGIDVRRFISFGVIKGFLRRVHRYPVYLRPNSSDRFQPSVYPSQGSVEPTNTDPSFPRKRGQSLSTATQRLIPYSASLPDDSPLSQASARLQSQSVAFPTGTPESTPYSAGEAPLPSAQSVISASHRARRASAAEKVLEQIRNRGKASATTTASPRTSWKAHSHDSIQSSNPLNTSNASSSSSAAQLPSISQASPTKGASNGKSDLRRQSITISAFPPSSPMISKAALAPSRPTRLSRSPSVPHIQLNPGQVMPPTIPQGFIELLDGEHHADELSVKFEAGWPLLESWLTAIGGTEGEGEYGRVSIIYK